MKYITTATLALLFLIHLTGCKKKNSSTSESTNNTTSSTPTHTNTFTAKVNGQDWTTYPNFFLTGKWSNNMFEVGGQSSSSTPYTNINIYFTPTIGTGSFNQCCPYTGTYYSNSHAYASLSGTINIAAFDTTSDGYIKTLKATFSFETQAVNSQSFPITQGLIDYIRP